MKSLLDLQSTVASSDNPVHGERERAIQIAARYVRRHLLSESAFRDSVTGCERVVVEYQRAHHKLERRRIHWDFEPAHGGRKADEVELPALPSDPWAIAVEDVRRIGPYVAACPVCDGNKTTACDECGAEGRLPCHECGAYGKVQGARGPKNCPRCRGRGTVDCPACRDGIRGCPACERKARVIAQAVMTRDYADATKVAPDSELAHSHRDVHSVPDFDRGTWPNELVEDRFATLAELPEALHPDIDSVTDRATATRLQTFRQVSWVITYQTLFGRGSVEVATQPMKGVTRHSDWPLRLRRHVAGAGGVSLGFATLVLCVGHWLRHEWFIQHGHAGALLLTATVATHLAVWATLGASLVPRAWSWMRTYIPVTAAFVSWAAAALLLLVPRPTAARAEEYLRAGDQANARLEADALMDLGVDRGEGARVLDRLNLERVQSLEDGLVVAKVVREAHWYHHEARSNALERLDELVEASSARYYAEQDQTGLRRLLDESDLLSDTRCRELRRWLATLEARSCIQAAQFECGKSKIEEAEVLGTESGTIQGLRAEYLEGLRAQFRDAVESADRYREIESRLEALRSALALRALLAEVEKTGVRPSSRDLERRVARAERSLARRDRLARAQQQRRERRIQRQREWQRRRATRRTVRRSRAHASLLCCDGSLSPTCSCSGPRRGCCSHHGGVCGCAN